MCRLTFGCPVPSSLATAEKLPVSTTRAKLFMRRNLSIGRPRVALFMQLWHEYYAKLTNLSNAEGRRTLSSWNKDVQALLAGVRTPSAMRRNIDRRNDEEARQQGGRDYRRDLGHGTGHGEEIRGRRCLCV